MAGRQVLGLTGSIGMGKTTTAAMFADAGADVWDADGAVHRLYAPGAAGTEAIAALCPEAVSATGVDRAALSQWLSEDPSRMEALEAAIHPLVQADRAAFLADAASEVVVLDIPLLYETGAETQCDAVAVVSAPAEIQRARVLARPGITDAKLDMILARQMPDEEKRARADYIIPTLDIEGATQAVHSIMEDLRGRLADA